MLFADDVSSAQVGIFAAVSLVSTTLGSAGTYLVNLLLKVRAENKAEASEERKDLLSHKQMLIDRQELELKQKDGEIAELQEEVRRGLDKISTCSVNAATMRAHIRYLESIVSRAGMSFEKFDERDLKGSTTHEPLKPQEA